MRNLVEKIVPADALLYLGVYIATWTHIELRLWKIVRSVQQLEPNPVSVTARDLELKNNTRSLIAAFRECKARLPPALCLQIEVLASSTAKGLRNRNLAAHGAVYFDDKRQELRVAHYFPDGRGSEKQWFEVDAAIRMPPIRNEVSNANKLLLDLNDLARQIEDYLGRGSS